MKMRRLLSIILCLCMFVSVFSMSAMADDVPPLFVPDGFDSGDGGGTQDPIIPPVDPDGQTDPPVVPDPPVDPDGQTDPPVDPDDQTDPPVVPKPPVDPNVPAPIADEPLPFTAQLASSGGVYDGANHLYTKVQLTVKYGDQVLTKGTDYTVERENLMIDADTYAITAIGVTGTTYEGMSATVYYTVSPITINVTAVNSSKTYGEEDPELSFNVETGYETMLSGTISREAGESAGTYSITQGSLESVSNNHVVSFTPGSFTINPKTISPVAVVAPDTLTYTGSELCPNVTVYLDSSKTTALDAAEYTVSYSNNINAGTAGFTVNDAAGGNYSFSSFGGNFTIAKANPVYTAPSAIPGLKYDGSVQQLVYPGSAPEGCTISYGMSQNGEYYNTVPVGQQLGTYSVWWKITGGNNYNDVGPYKISVSITAYTAGDKVADMIRDLSWLPGGNVDPGNDHQRNAVLNVWNAYHNLPYSEQKKVPAELYDWLYYLVSNTDYAIIAGNGSTWYKGKSSGISFTAIDPVGKFAGVRVDGVLIDSSNYYYSGEADTCIVTLKPSYLTNLGFGQHSVSICYWNGYAPGHFYIMEAAGSPPTGDTANFPLWGSMMLISTLGLAAAAGLILKRKKNEG